MNGPDSSPRLSQDPREPRSLLSSSCFPITLKVSLNKTQIFNI